MMGYTSQEGYEHESSKAIRGDKFCGLLCDEINQDDLTVERVKNWVAQLKSEGILEQDKARVNTAAPSASVVGPAETESMVINGQQDLISKLEAENSRLRKMLEDSKVMDGVLRAEMMSEESFIPHYNAKTGATMWTSADGRRCYYTTDAPKSP